MCAGVLADVIRCVLSGSDGCVLGLGCADVGESSVAVRGHGFTSSDESGVLLSTLIDHPSPSFYSASSSTSVPLQLSSILFL